jgi:hypothetical protein
VTPIIGHCCGRTSGKFRESKAGKRLRSAQELHF